MHQDLKFNIISDLHFDIKKTPKGLTFDPNYKENAYKFLDIIQTKHKKSNEWLILPGDFFLMIIWIRYGSLMNLSLKK